MLRNQFLQVNDLLNHKFIENEDVARGLVLGLLARTHVLLVGPPGVGKTEMAKTLAYTFGGNFFAWQLTPYTKDYEIFGPEIVSMLVNHAIAERNTLYKLPWCHIAFLDEFFNANSGLLQTLLSTLNERTFYNGTREEEIPLEFAILASNELPPKGEGLEAIWDRIGLKYVVKTVQDEQNFLRMIEAAEKKSRTNKIIPFLQIEDIKKAQEEVSRVKFGEEGLRMHRILRRALLEKNIYVSNRKYIQIIPLLKANAFLEGRNYVNAEDYQVLKHVFWRDYEEKEEIEMLLSSLLLPHLGEVSKMEQSLTKIFKEVISLHPGDEQIHKAEEVSSKFIEAMKRLNRYITHPNVPQNDKRMVHEVLERLTKMNSHLANIILDLPFVNEGEGVA